MTDKNQSNQNENDFLEAKMYYYNTDALTARDQILNSKGSSGFQPGEQKQNVLEIKTPLTKKLAGFAAKNKTSLNRRKADKNPSQKKILERLAGLEDMYKQLVKTLDISKVSIEIESIQKNNEKFEEQISQLEQERLTLLEQITSLEAQIIFSTELEAEKNELKQQVTILSTEKQDLENLINQLKKEMNDFSETISSLENKKNIIYLSKEREALEARITVVMQEKRELYLHIQKLTAENQELMKSINVKEKNTKIDPQKQRLLERVDELEQERLHLFKIVGELEEAKKASPELVEKNDLLLVENQELKSENSNSKKQIAEFLKNAKNMQTEIIQLKEKRASRLELEQEKGRLQKRIKDLEEQCSKLANTIKNLNIQISENQKDNPDLEQLRKEIIQLEQKKIELKAQTKNDQDKIQQLSETISAEKGSENTYEAKIIDLNNENKKLSEKIKTMQLTQPINYVLDLEKLADLKNFVLESIQTRRWKSTEFVNGAYDAVGLFYRAILQEVPIKTNR
ncbi:MAG: hypothetical protein KKD05_04095 [Candidatus Omnitrophica bacterium]|nr:hypothetical protein [Candidatus Omnitrophota bacterium]